MSSLKQIVAAAAGVAGFAFLALNSYRRSKDRAAKGPSDAKENKEHKGNSLFDSSKTAGLSDPLYEYLLDVSLRETAVQRALREETAGLGAISRMQSAPDQQQFFQLLLQTLKAKKCIEIGVFTGYSTLSCALALPPEGKIVAVDISEKFTNIGKKYWEQTGVAHMIDLHLRSGTEVIQQLIHDGQGGTFDFGFVDADKANYDAYYEGILQLLRPGGVVAIDNTLWHGQVLDPNARDNDTLAIKALNLKLKQDPRIRLAMLGIADGVTLCYKL